MGDEIKGNEIIQDNHLDNAVKSTKELIKFYETLDEKIKATAKTAKKGLGGVDPNSAKGIQQVNAEVANSIKLRKAQIDINKKRQQLQREEIKTNELIANQTKKAIANKKREDAADQKRLKTIRDSNSAYKKQSKELADLSRRFKDLSIAGRGSGKVARGLLVDIKKLNAGLVKADAATGKFGRNVGNYPKALGKASIGLKKFAGALGLTSGIFLLVNGLKDAVKLVAAFEQANANLASILGTTKSGITALTEDAKRLGSTTSFTASQIVELQTELAKLGFSKKQILESTEAIQGLAAAVGVDLAEAAAVAGATLGGFGLEASETQRVTDVMAKSFSSSALDMEKFRESMKTAAPAAAAVGVSIEETTALLGILANSGISGSKAGSSLKATFIELNAAGLTLEEGLSKVANSQDKLGTATKLVGKLAATSFLVLAEGTEATAELTEALENSGGAAKEMADTQLDTLTGSLTLLSSAYEGFILSLEDGDGEIAKWVRTTIDATTVLFNFLGGIEQTDEALESLRFGDTIVKVKNFIDTWKVAFESVENFVDAMKDTVDILTLIITFGLVENVSDDFLGLADSVEKYGAEQREAVRITAAAQFGIKKLTASVTEYTVKEQSRITALAEGNLTQEQRNALIEDLNAKYPELLVNYDLENLSQEDAIRLNKELQIEIINTAILKQKALALTFLDNEAQKEQDRINKITNSATKKRAQEQLDFEIKRQSGRIDAVEEETRIRLGLKKIIDDTNDSEDEGLDNIEDSNITGKGKKGKGKKRDISTAADEEEARLTKIRLKRIAAEKKRLADENDDFNEFLNEKERLETAHLERVLTDQELEENAVRDKYFNLIEQAIKYNKDTALLEEARQAELQDIQDRADENRRLEQEKSDKEAEEERLKQQKQNLETTVEIFKIATDAISDNLDAKIEKSKLKLTESEGAVERLEARASEGFVDAEQSIKAEKQKIANEKENIDKLEKRKRDLLIVVAGLELLSQKINSGDTNATASASSDLNGFLSGLEGAFGGTDINVGQHFGNSIAISGDKDTHVGKFHKDEKILSVKNSRKIQSMHQDDITKGALMLQNGEFMAGKAVNNVITKNVFDDNRMVSAISKNTEAINNIDIPVRNSDYNALTKMFKDQVKTKNKTINTYRKVNNMM